MFNFKIIHRQFLIENINHVRQRIPNALVCAMVKANAYGVGLKETVKILSPYADFFGVACFDEAKQVRRLCLNNILIVGPLDECNEDFSQAVQSLAEVSRLVASKKKIKIHIKINSGMNRYGFKDFADFCDALKLIKNSNLILEGIFTHFATTDNFMDEQMQVFTKYVEACKDMGFNPIVHADNSFASENHCHGLDMVRIGFDLFNKSNGVAPVVEIKSRTAKINEIEPNELVGYDYRYVAHKRMKVAVVPVGYADGFDLSFLGMNLKVKNIECKVLNICMDCFMIDVSNTNLKEGDYVSILGKENNLKKYAKYINTSEYEICTKFSKIRAKIIVN